MRAEGRVCPPIDPQSALITLNVNSSIAMIPPGFAVMSCGSGRRVASPWPSYHPVVAEARNGLRRFEVGGMAAKPASDSFDSRL
jgi:hypothetical protein